MRKVVFNLLLCGVIMAGLSACNARQREAAPAANEPPAVTTPAAIAPTAPPAAVLAPRTANPFGVMVMGKTFAERIRRARLLGVRYYRPAMAIFTKLWTGSDAECDAARAAGLELVITIRNGEPRQPAEPPTDEQAYARVVGEVCARYHPALFCVENEENSQALFYAGTPEEYLRHLGAAVRAARAHGVKVTNGGLVSDLVAILTAEAIRDGGNSAAADAYLQRTLSPEFYRQRGSARYREQLLRGRTLLAGYRAAGGDYVNFHWYNADPADLQAAVEYLGKAAGIPAVCNEAGQQKNEDPEQVRTILTKFSELNLPIVVWFSMDIAGYAEARGLFDEEGVLRPNGTAFQTFIREHYAQ